MSEQESTPEALRARGSLKWTGAQADVAAWVAESDLGTAPAVEEAVREALGRGLLGYLPPAVRSDLGRAVADWQRSRYGWDVDPARVMPVGDVRDALRLTLEQLTPPGTPVVIPTPTYMPFLTAPRVWGREVVPVPHADVDGRPALDLDALARALATGPGALVVLINPHNPTGRVLTRAELTALAEVVDAHGGRVFADEVHAPLTLAGARHVPYASVSAAAAAHSVTATSASKAWNVAGLKCAQLVLTCDDDVEVWRAHDGLLTEGAATLGAVANTAAYRDGGPWLDALLDRLVEHRDLFAAVLTERAPLVTHRPAEGTYLAWLDLRAALDRVADAPPWRTAPVGALADWVLDRSGVAVVDGAACGEVGRGFVRVNLAMPLPLVREAGDRLAACLAT